VIANVSGLGCSFISGGIITRITSILYRLSFNWPYKVFFQNNEDLNEFIKRGFVEKIKAERLPGSGVDLNKFRPVKTKKREKITFLLVARLLWDKGIGEYISAAREIKKKYFNTEFQIIGFADSDNPSAIPKSNIDRWVEEGIINYLGYTDNIMEKYANVDCVVLPSYYREGVPRSLLEAASMAIPIITTSAVGCRDVVDDGINGFLCQPKNVNDLTAKIERMILLTHDQRREMGLKGRIKMERYFDEQIILQKYLTAIFEIKQLREVSLLTANQI
jgi:glycosyltransferase involved in cell wall biosynthesis